MTTATRLLSRLTADAPVFEEREGLLSEFADEYGWSPCDIVDEPSANGRLGNAHLLVEHGLSDAAVLTFLPANRPTTSLQRDEHRRLLGLSYNNLVDWHVLIERHQVSYVFNRRQQLEVAERIDLTPADFSGLERRRFGEVARRPPKADVPPLDDALIEIVSRWRRLLAAELGEAVTNKNFSALFNAILLARAIEDHRRPEASGRRSALLDALDAEPPTAAELFRRAVRNIADVEIADELWAPDLLKPFDQLDRSALRDLLAEFYYQRGGPYHYDFSVISKHALSRIYERYVTELRVAHTPQLPLLPLVPDEERARGLGSIYTPQFIARFFARFLRDNLPAAVFRRARVADTACGSGIFLRSILETQIEANRGIRPPGLISDALSNLFGVDVDENACAATRLSLAVLHLVHVGQFPEHLSIDHGDGLRFGDRRQDLRQSMDAVVVNPPFIRTEDQSQQLREQLGDVLAGVTAGRLDSYFGFLKTGVELLRPGGFGLFVVPQAFLVSESGAGLRAWIAEKAWIRCVVDLSMIPVFEGTGAYVILLILERKTEHGEPPPATMVRCQGFPGQALQDFLHGKRMQTSYYSLFDVDQSEFRKREWVVVSPHERSLGRRLSRLPTLGSIARVGQGVITGADRGFVRAAQAIPRGEEDAYRPYLPDRAITRYALPQRAEWMIFYPFAGESKLSDGEISESFPATWHHLEEHRAELAQGG